MCQYFVVKCILILHKKWERGRGLHNTWEIRCLLWSMSTEGQIQGSHQRAGSSSGEWEWNYKPSHRNRRDPRWVTAQHHEKGLDSFQFWGCRKAWWHHEVCEWRSQCTDLVQHQSLVATAPSSGGRIQAPNNGGTDQSWSTGVLKVIRLSMPGLVPQSWATRKSPGHAE
jgi:hypothetical protein